MSAVLPLLNYSTGGNNDRLDWVLRGSMDVAWLEWEVYSVGIPYERQLGILGSWRSDKRE